MISECQQVGTSDHSVSLTGTGSVALNTGHVEW